MNISKEIKIGIVSAVAIACFIYGFNYLKGINFFATENKFYAVYENIDGLVEANPLIISGYKKGIVSDIQLIDNSRAVLVTMLLDESVQIPRNTIAKVVSSDLLGSKAIQLVLGDSPLYAEDGDTLKSEMEVGLRESVDKTIAPLKKKAESLISSIDSVMIVVQEIFTKDARKSLSGSFSSFSRSLNNLEKTSLKIDNMVTDEKEKISSILSKANILATTLANNSAKLSNTISNLSDLSDSLKKAEISNIILTANSTLMQTNEIMEKINSGEGTLGLLINNDTIHKQLDQSLNNLNKLLVDLRINPDRYVPLKRKNRKERRNPVQE